MKTYHKHLKIGNNTSIVLIVLITLFGLSIKTKAQSPALENDEIRIKTSMKVKLNDFDFDVLIPKITSDELNAYTEVKFNHLVFVSDKNPGFYKFFNNQWTKKSVKEVLEVIEMNLVMGSPLVEDIILTTNNNRNLLDYNSHVDHLYRGFVFENGGTQLAINIVTERE